MAAIVIIPISSDLTGRTFGSTYLHSAISFSQGITHCRDCSAGSYATPGDASARKKMTFSERCHFFFNTANIHPSVTNACLLSRHSSVSVSVTQGVQLSTKEFMKLMVSIIRQFALLLSARDIFFSPLTIRFGLLF